MSGTDTGPPDVDLGRVWLGVAAQVWRREPRWVERLAGRLLRSPGLARALVTTPSLLLGWLIATAVVLVAGMLATLGTGTPYVPLLAPAVAGAGIAYAYGPGIDPAWELSRSMAVSDRMVLLVRALAVFGLNAALGLALSAASGGRAAATVGWAVPATTGAAPAAGASPSARSAPSASSGPPAPRAPPTPAPPARGIRPDGHRRPRPRRHHPRRAGPVRGWLSPADRPRGPRVDHRRGL